MRTNKLIFFIIILFIFSFINLVDDISILIRQIIWCIVSLILFNTLDKKIIIKYTKICYIIINIMLLYLLLFGKSINGSKCWIDFKYFSIQPSELMKVFLIVYLCIISKKENKYVRGFIITIIPAILTFLEPDTGNVIFYILIYLSFIFYNMKSKKNMMYIILALILIISSFIITYFTNKEILLNLFGSDIIYRFDRLLLFLNKDSYQLNQSLINIGTSSYLGNDGFYIPEANTDFAFSKLIGKMGYIGIIIYLIVNLLLDFEIIKKIKSNNYIISQVSFMLIIMKTGQSFIHIFMNIGLFPITGITLPFISYGGSSLLSYILLICVINNKTDCLDKDKTDYLDIEDKDNNILVEV